MTTHKATPVPHQSSKSTAPKSSSPASIPANLSPSPGRVSSGREQHKGSTHPRRSTPPPPPPTKKTPSKSASSLVSQGPSAKEHPSKGPMTKDDIWYTSDDVEKDKIREFWLHLSEADRRELVRQEKEAVLSKMRDQQKHNCNCPACGRKRSVIEEELEILYDAYYEELENFAVDQRRVAAGMPCSPHCAYHQQQHGTAPSRQIQSDTTDHLSMSKGNQGSSALPFSAVKHQASTLPPSIANASPSKGPPLPLPPSDVKPTSTLQNSSRIAPAPSSMSSALFDFNGRSQPFRPSSTPAAIQKGIMTVADDFMRNDGRKFLDLMEQLASRKLMQRRGGGRGRDRRGGSPRTDRAPQDNVDDEASYEEEYDIDTEDDNLPEDEEEEEIEDVGEDDDDDEEEEEGDEEDDDYCMTEEQRMEEGRRMFQIFAAKMFEQRVLQAYREKLAKDRQAQFLLELQVEEEEKARQESAKQASKERKRLKKVMKNAAKKEQQEALQKEKEAALATSVPPSLEKSKSTHSTINKRDEKNEKDEREEQQKRLRETKENEIRRQMEERAKQIILEERRERERKDAEEIARLEALRAEREKKEAEDIVQRERARKAAAEEKIREDAERKKAAALEKRAALLEKQKRTTDDANTKRAAMYTRDKPIINEKQGIGSHSNSLFVPAQSTNELPPASSRPRTPLLFFQTLAENLSPAVSPQILASGAPKASVMLNEGHAIRQASIAPNDLNIYHGGGQPSFHSSNSRNSGSTSPLMYNENAQAQASLIPVAAFAFGAHSAAIGYSNSRTNIPAASAFPPHRSDNNLGISLMSQLQNKPALTHQIPSTSPPPGIHPPGFNARPNATSNLSSGASGLGVLVNNSSLNVPYLHRTGSSPLAGSGFASVGQVTESMSDPFPTSVWSTVPSSSSSSKYFPARANHASNTGLSALSNHLYASGGPNVANKGSQFAAGYNPLNVISPLNEQRILGSLGLDELSLEGGGTDVHAGSNSHFSNPLAHHQPLNQIGGGHYLSQSKYGNGNNSSVSAFAVPGSTQSDGPSGFLNSGFDSLPTRNSSSSFSSGLASPLSEFASVGFGGKASTHIMGDRTSSSLFFSPPPSSSSQTGMLSSSAPNHHPLSGSSMTSQGSIGLGIADQQHPHPPSPSTLWGNNGHEGGGVKKNSGQTFRADEWTSQGGFF